MMFYCVKRFTKFKILDSFNKLLTLLCNCHFDHFDPFESDHHQISPCNINALLNRVVMRITDMITHDEFA